MHHNSHTPDAAVGQKQCSFKEPMPLPPQSPENFFLLLPFFTWMHFEFSISLSRFDWPIYSTCLPQTCKGSWDNEFLTELETFSRYGKYDQKYLSGISLAVQWLRLHASNAGTVGSIPGQELRSHLLQEEKKKHLSDHTTGRCHFTGEETDSESLPKLLKVTPVMGIQVQVLFLRQYSSLYNISSPRKCLSPYFFYPGLEYNFLGRSQTKMLWDFAQSRFLTAVAEPSLVSTFLNVPQGLRHSM